MSEPRQADLPENPYEPPGVTTTSTTYGTIAPWRRRAAFWTLLGSYGCLLLTAAIIYTLFRLAGDNFFGLFSLGASRRIYRILDRAFYAPIYLGAALTATCILIGGWKQRAACIPALFIFTYLLKHILRL